MNILFLSRDYPPNLIGGVGIYVCEMSRVLARMGHNVFVLSEGKELPCEYEEEGVRVFRIIPSRLNYLNPLRGKLKGLVERLEYSHEVSKKIKQIVKRYKIDVIESCEARAEGAWYYLFERYPPLVVKLHTPESIVFRLDKVTQTLDYYLIRYLEEWWIRRANKVIGLSKSIVDLSCKFFRIAYNNFPIVPNPVDTEYFRPENRKGIQDSPLILYVGRLEFRKGVHVLIRSIPAVLKHFPEAKFLFIGDDCGMKEYMNKNIDELKLRENIELIGQIWRSELLEYYRKSTICIIPSLWENHPFVLLEAMSCGKPVIASNAGGMAEIIDHGKDGILVPPGSPQLLADNIVDILKNDEKRKNLGENARKKMESQYSPFKVVQKTLAIYEQLIERQ